MTRGGVACRNRPKVLSSEALACTLLEVLGRAEGKDSNILLPCPRSLLLKERNLPLTEPGKVGVVTMSASMVGTGTMRPATVGSPRPRAFFVGDFNVGKSAVINALLRRELLPTALEESTLIPTVVGHSPGRQRSLYGFLPADAGRPGPLTCSQFQDIRVGSADRCHYRALLASLWDGPFSDLLLIDSPGVSSVRNPGAGELSSGADGSSTMVSIVDAEYWSARHTINFLKSLSEHFSHLVVVANKADQLTAAEIRRLRERGEQRLAGQGISSIAGLFVVSARLEHARWTDPDNDYRTSTRQAVRDLCDTDFDRLRLSLYEFEAQARTPAWCDEATQLQQLVDTASLDHMPSLEQESDHKENATE